MSQHILVWDNLELCSDRDWLCDNKSKEVEQPGVKRLFVTLQTKVNYDPIKAQIALTLSPH